MIYQKKIIAIGDCLKVIILWDNNFHLNLDVCFWKMSFTSIFMERQEAIICDNTSLHWHYLLIIFATTNLEPGVLCMLAPTSWWLFFPSSLMSLENIQTLITSETQTKVMLCTKISGDPVITQSISKIIFRYSDLPLIVTSLLVWPESPYRVSLSWLHPSLSNNLQV